MSTPTPRATPCCVIDHSQHCVTCGDDGVPMSVLEDLGDGLATCVDEHGASTIVEVTLVEPVVTGSCVLVHAGVAIAALGEVTV
jgi:hypothetical protein